MRAVVGAVLRAAYATVCAASLFATTPARAAEIGDPAADFRIRVDVAGADTCIVVPAELRSAESCRGLDPPAIEQRARMGFAQLDAVDRAPPPRRRSTFATLFVL